MRFLTLILLAALPLSASQRVYLRAGHRAPRIVVGLGPVMIASHGLRCGCEHRHHRHYRAHRRSCRHRHAVAYR